MGQSFYDHGHPHHGRHDHGHGSQAHTHGAARWGYALFTAAVGVLLLLYWLGSIRSLFGIDLALALTLVAGYPLIQHAVSDLLRGRLSSHLTIAIAAAAAIAIGEYFAAAEVMFIMLVGEGLESFTVDRAKRAIAGFVQMQPTLARVRRNGEEHEISPAEVRVDDTVIVRAGEKVPVDGVVTVGESTVDQSMITGEPMPGPKRAGDAIYSGSINEYGVLEIRAERVGEETTLARIAQLIREAQRRRAPIVRTADRLAKYFLPAVVLAGGAIYLFTGEMIRTVAALIVACPCALVLATPAAVAAAIARLAREGVLVKGGEVVESLGQVDGVAFDKTGTLTAGRPAVSGLLPAPGVDQEELLALAAAAEQPSEHLLGRAIVEEARKRKTTIPEADEFAVRPGMGVQAKVGGQEVRVGNLALAREAGVELSWVERAEPRRSHEGQTEVVVTADGRPVGVIGLRDPVRPDAADAVVALEELGITRICMLTGDEQATAESVGRQAGIREIYAGLLPEEKVRKLRELRREGCKTLMVGDGINDAPSLATADVGLAMGRGAADISAEAAQVVFLKDRLLFIPNLIAYSRKAIHRIRWSILLFAFGVNFAAVVVAAFGKLSPAAAAIVHQGASLAVILNCVRLLFEGKAVDERRAGDLLAPLGRRLHHLRHALKPPPLDQLRGWLQRRGPQLGKGSLALAGLLWLGSGLVQIDAGELGLAQRFGRLVEPPLRPGLHLRWPWPVEKVTKIQPRKVRALEIGFRINDGESDGQEPAAYEWNVRHTQGRLIQRLDESLMLTGDENLVETYATVLYAIADPALYLFRVKDAEELVRVTAERTLRWTVASFSLDAILTSQREAIEGLWQERLEEALVRYGSGVEVVSVHLKDVHPPVEVVPAFREVASALEVKATLINEAEGYLKEQVPLARGQAQARLLEAKGYSLRRVDHSQGESVRFAQRAGAYRAAPDVTAFRLYVETMEDVLPDKRKYIADGKRGGRRRFLFLDSSLDGAERSLVNLVEPETDEEP